MYYVFKKMQLTLTHERLNLLINLHTYIVSNIRQDLQYNLIINTNEYNDLFIVHTLL